MFFEVCDGIGEAEIGHVEPSEISGLDGRFDADTGQFTRDEIEEEIAMAAQRGKQGLTPWLAVPVGGFAGGETEASDFGHDAGGGAHKLGAQRRVTDDCKRGAEAGDIVGLARRHECERARGECG